MDINRYVVLKTNCAVNSFPNEPEDFVIVYSGQILLLKVDENDREIGTFKIYKANLGMALDYNQSWKDVLDAYEATSLFIPLVDHSNWKQKVVEKFDVFDNDLLLLDRVELIPAFRGYGFGLVALKAAMDAWGSGCGLIGCKPFPPQFENNVNSENRKEFEEGRQKLFKYWSRLGFKKYGKELMVLSTAQKSLEYDQILTGITAVP